jgi:GT2 family glycosyltransferase
MTFSDNNSIQQARVTVVIPVYNDEKTLGKCLKALVPCRENPKWEFIVVDDNSSDDSARVASEAGFRVIKLERNLGVSAARNTGARATDSNIIIFVDADIVPEPGSLEAMVEILETRRGIHAVGAYPLPVDLSPEWSSHFVGLRSAWGYHWKEGESERKFSSIQSECGAIRRETFDLLGGFSERHGGVGMEEFHMAHEMEDQGLGHLLIKSSAYRHHYKPLFSRSRALIDRTARWVPLLIKRKKFESYGAVGTASAAFSCVLTYLWIVLGILSPVAPGLLFFSAAIFIVQLILEAPFLFFVRKMNGWWMVLYALGALQIMHLSIGLGFIIGVFEMLFRGEEQRRGGNK